MDEGLKEERKKRWSRGKMLAAGPTVTQCNGRGRREGWTMEKLTGLSCLRSDTYRKVTVWGEMVKWAA